MATRADFEHAPFKQSWSVVAEATNANAVATRAAAAGMRHVLVTVDATYSSTSTSGVLTVEFGSTVVAKKYIHGSGSLDFTYKGLIADKNQSIVVTLASGGAGVTGIVTITGYSVSEA